jgi:UDP-glucose 4-epimerase
MATRKLRQFKKGLRMTVLVTGGAGYIGSHMVLALQERGEKVVVLDNLSTGTRALVAREAEFVQGDAGDRDLVSNLIATAGIDAIAHFAGSIIVPESVQTPLEYYRNNTMVARNLIDVAVSGRVRHFIFSSTAAVYGCGSGEPINEACTVHPVNPYGRSKLMTEWMLEDVSKAYDLSYAVLRYFNVAGADPKGRSGQANPAATHLIKRAVRVALGQVPYLEIFGTDYPTHDGTGVRDYIHVSDLIVAHELALDYLRGGGNSVTMNCGYGHGASVREVVTAVERVTGSSLPVHERPRRTGDSPALVADSRLIKRMLGWEPKCDDLDAIVRSAYQWECGLETIA